VILDEPRPDGATKFEGLQVAMKAGTQCWMYEGVPAPDLTMNAVVGMPPESWREWMQEPRRYDMIRPGCSDPVARLDDMDLDGVHAQLGFPSWCNFSGTRFLFSKDLELADLCVQAYNDFVIDEWCGAAPARFIPMVILPLWDRVRCVEEIERTAAKGAKAISFPENPAPLDLPSFHSRDWDPVFAAAQDAQMPLCMHFGTSGTVPEGSPGSSPMVRSSVMGINSMLTAAELVYSHVFHEFPRLKVSLAEGGLGWVPWLLQRVDSTWHKMRPMLGIPDGPTPSELFREHIYACGIDDEAGIAMRDRIGVDHTLLESDYPHLDTAWPDTRKRAAEMLADVPDDEAHKIAELNARTLFRHEL
jgi:predicted TIM-barrel fold metal-dependent hydrolase